MENKQNLDSEKDIEQNLDEGVDSNLEATQEELKEEENKAENNKENEENYETLLNQKVQELEDLNNSYLRLKADFTNYKNRVQKEKQAVYAYAAEEIVTGLLEVVDNFERALESVDEKDRDNSLYQGVEMIYNQLMASLKKAGLEEIKALNEKFDPNLHHGVAQEESKDHEEDTILEVFQKGYKLKDKVIRPSMVKISK